MVDLDINYNINFKDVLVIDENGTQLGVMSRDVAIEKAEEKGLDLIMVGKNSSIPTCKLMDYGKYSLKKKRKQRKIKKQQKLQKYKFLLQFNSTIWKQKQLLLNV